MFLSLLQRPVVPSWNFSQALIFVFQQVSGDLKPLFADVYVSVCGILKGQFQPKTKIL